MFKHNFAVAIRTNGKILREQAETVTLPFGSEYELVLKNLNTVRCKVWVSIDDTDVLDGDCIILNAGDTLNLERSIKNGNLNTGNKFKFIERTANIEQHRGVGLTDGVVQVKYQFDNPTPTYSPVYTSGSIFRSADSWPSQPMDRRLKTKGTNEPNLMNNYAANATYCSTTQTGIARNVNSVQSDVGITVPGSISSQQFVTVSDFYSSQPINTICLQLRGRTEEKVVTTPVTVKTKPKCVTCGRTNKANTKFCSECGTSLTIV